MSGGFTNAITGQNGSLIRQQIMSPNFVTGVSGWIIRKDGSAEFNGALFRGSVVITQSQDLLIYSSSTPQANKLLIALAGSAGNDGLGNSWSAGLNQYDANGVKTGIWTSGGFRVINDPGSGYVELVSQNNAVFSPIFNFVGTPGNSSTVASMYVNGGPVGSAETWNITGAIRSGDTKSSQTGIEISSATNSINDSANMILFFGDSNGFFGAITITNAGAAIVGSATAVQPGTGTSTAIAVPETWHSPGLAANWTNGNGTQQPISYRLSADGTVQVTGTLHATAAQGAGATVWTMPAGYVPSKQQNLPCELNNGGAVSMNHLIVNTTGTVQTDVAVPNAADVYISSYYRLS
jgi:hypothetical protein